MTAQGSASERIEQARKALGAAAMYGVSPGMSAQREARMVLDLTEALRALITPPSVGESAEQIAARVAQTAPSSLIQMDGSLRFEPEVLVALLGSAVRAGIQSAHETWEPADKPSQEQMLRWLGIEYDETDGVLFIPDQHIEREEV